MSINTNYKFPVQYSFGDLKNDIYLYPFNSSHITYDESEATNIDGKCVLLHCNSVQYTSSEGINNAKFAFNNTLTITLREEKNHTYYDIIEKLITKSYYVVFKDRQGTKYILNAEYEPEITYSYTFGDNAVGNICTITMTANQNVPTIKYSGELNVESELRNKICKFNLGKVKSLTLMDADKVAVKITDDEFEVTELQPNAINVVNPLKSTLVFTDSYDGSRYTHNVSFSIPFKDYKYSFHYDLLKFTDNIYYAIIETTNDNFILCGWNSGLFPSYSINTTENNNENTIAISLNGYFTSFATLTNDAYTEYVDDGSYYVPIDGRCINGLYTTTLVNKYNSDKTPTNDFYCFKGYEEEYSTYHIVGTYASRYDTSFGFSLVNSNYDCIPKKCSINGLPEKITFNGKGVTQTFPISTNCSNIIVSNTCSLVNATYNNGLLSVTSLESSGNCSISLSTSDGDTYTIEVEIKPSAKDFEQSFDITPAEQTISVYLHYPNSLISSITNTSNLQLKPITNGYLISVSKNNTSIERVFTLVFNYQNGTKETITINQDYLKEVGKPVYRWHKTQETACIDDGIETNCEKIEDVDYDPNDNTTYYENNGKKFYIRNKYISIICDDYWEYIGFEVGDEIIDSSLPYGVTTITEYGTYTTFFFSGQIPYQRFMGNSIESVYVEEPINDIGMFAFASCEDLEEVSLPNTITNIQPYAFRNCVNLTSITFRGTKAQWNNISLGYYWYDGSALEIIHCTDGDIYIEPEPEIEHYIQTSDEGCFITDYYGNENSRYEFKFAPIDDTFDYTGIMSVGRYYSYLEGMSYCTQAQSYNLSCNWNGTGDEGITPYEPSKIYEVSLSVNNLSVSGKDETYTFTSENSWNGHPNAPLSICRIHEWTGWANYSFKGRLYYFKVYEGDTLVKDYIPYVQDGVVGLYDKVSNTFLAPEAGTFTYHSTDPEPEPETNKSVILTLTDDTTQTDTFEDGIIPSSQYEGNTSIKSAIIGDGITSIGGNGFLDNTSLTSVTIGSNVTSIGDGCFARCYDLPTINIPDSVTSIGDNAFLDDRGLTSVTIGSSVTRFGNGSFAYCYGLRNIYYNETIAQWNNISKGGSWKSGVYSCVVHCTDGDISL